MHNKSVIGYSGEVTIKYNKSGKTIELKKHNEGFTALFRTIASLLSGDGFPFGSIYGVSLKVVTTGGEYNLLNNQVIPITQRPRPVMLSDGGYACSVNTTIAASDRNSTTVGSDDAVYLYLVSSNNTELAKVEIEKEAVTSIAPGVQLFIQWDLIINNAPQA